MRTLIFLCLLAGLFCQSASAQETRTEFVQNPDGTWQAMQVMSKTKILQPQDVTFTKEEMSSGNTIEKRILLDRNDVVALWIEFQPDEGIWFSFVNHFSVQSYTMQNGAIVPKDKAYVQNVINSNMPWIMWIVVLLITSCICLHVFLMSETPRQSIFCQSTFLVCSVLMAYLPLNGWMMLLACVLATTFAISSIVGWDRWAITIVTSLLLYSQVRAVTDGREWFLLLITTISLVLGSIRLVVLRRSKNKVTGHGYA